MTYYVYILCSQRNGTLYVGVTNDLVRRVYEHKNKFVKGFTTTYGIDKLVYFEEHGDINEAIYREKCIKHWNRLWKLRLIESHNPEWIDLYQKLQGLDPRLRGDDREGTWMTERGRG